MFKLALITRVFVVSRNSSMTNDTIQRLRELVEPMASVSLSHLHPATRGLLLRNALSVNVYPTEVGGLLYVGTPRQRIPAEQDLDVVTRFAEKARIAWLLFDAEAPIVEGLPVFSASD